MEYAPITRSCTMLSVTTLDCLPKRSSMITNKKMIWLDPLMIMILIMTNSTCLNSLRFPSEMLRHDLILRSEVSLLKFMMAFS